MPSNMILPSSHSRNSSGNSVTFGTGSGGVLLSHSRKSSRSSPISSTLPTPVMRNPRVIKLSLGAGVLFVFVVCVVLYGHRNTGFKGYLPGHLDKEEVQGFTLEELGNLNASANTENAVEGVLGEDLIEPLDESQRVPSEYGWPSVEGTGTWPGYTSTLARKLVSGLDTIPPNPDLAEPLSNLGEEADSTYVFGPRDLEEYTHSLHSFIEASFPANMRDDLKAGLELYTTVNDTEYLTLDGLGGKDGWRNIWMTDKDNSRLRNNRKVKTWQENDDNWGFKFLDDWEMEKWVSTRMQGSLLGTMWDALPLKILKADTLRYLLLLISGSIYTDIDTRLLKSIPQWGSDPDLWNEAEGWLGDEAARDVRKKWKSLPRPSVVIGIEADVGDRGDWHQWWPRPLQVVQWTLASTPHHPIFIDVLQSIMRATSKAVTWDVSRQALIRQLRGEGREAEADLASSADVRSEPSEGGPVGVMNWTGPGVWTDAVIRYLRVRYGLQWTDLRALKKPLRVGEVVILPVTGFSPNVGLFGAKTFRDAQAMVEHSFAGSWKGQDK